MAKVYQKQNYIQALYERFNQKFLDGDYLGALDTLNTYDSVNGENDYSIANKARVYYAMKRYSLATHEWFKFLSNANHKKDFSRAYSGLGACLYKMGEIGVAGYYFKMQIVEDKTFFCEYSHVAKEYYDEVVFSKDNYYIAYPYDIADYTKTIEKSERFMKNGDFQGAIDNLKHIPENSKFYPTALVIKSIAKFFTNDIQGAIEDVEKSIEIQPTIASVCNAISIFTSVGNNEKAEYYVEKLKEVKSDNGEDDNKIAMIYCERNNDELAKIYAKNYLSKNPYDSVMVMLLGMIYYNLKDYKNSEILFKKAYKISRGYVCKYYLNLSQTKALNRLEYNLDLPEIERKKILKRLGELIRAENTFRIDNQEEIYNLADYAFTSDNYQVQSSLITLLGELSTEKSYGIMKNALILPNVFDRIKSGVVGFLVADGVDGELSVVFSNVFKKITVHKAKFNKINNVFTEAYAYLYAKLCHLEDNMQALKISAENIYDKLLENDNIREILDVKSLSAVIYELSSISDIKSRREFASFFDANLREIKRIKGLL